MVVKFMAGTEDARASGSMVTAKIKAYIIRQATSRGLLKHTSIDNKC